MKNATGYDGEIYAAHYLKRKRYKLVDARFRSRFGEIDLIFRHRKVIVFVEVKLRKNKDFSEAFEAVTYTKQQKIIKTAQHWLQLNKCDLQPRFDIVEIYTDLGEINHIENAFGG
ncbi:MAG: YraN family protein [Clostridia bacterium]|nr:YraN family protein [Clostridia bacterium]